MEYALIMTNGILKVHLGENIYVERFNVTPIVKEFEIGGRNVKLRLDGYHKRKRFSNGELKGKWNKDIQTVNVDAFKSDTSS